MVYVHHQYTIVHPVHNVKWVVHDVMYHHAPGARCCTDGAQCCAPSCTGCTMLHLWCTMLYGWSTMLCTIVQKMHDAILVVNDVVHHHARCFMVVQYIVHHRAPGAQCYMGSARCRAHLCAGCTMLYGWGTSSCTTVHRVHDIIWVVHYVVHHDVPGARCYIGGA